MAAIGIDLGTCNSCVGVFRNDRVEIIANEFGMRTTPSLVAFTETGRLIGHVVKCLTNTEDIVYDVKRFIGSRFDDVTVHRDLKHLWPFAAINDGGKLKIMVKYKGEMRMLFPEEILSMLLHKMKRTAEIYLGESVTNAVITVPCHFNYNQRHAIKDAACVAGLNVLNIMNDSTMAAFAYGLNRKFSEAEHKVLVFDLGGSNCNVSIVVIEDGIFEVKATSGAAHVGGQDFDTRLMEHFVAQCKATYSRDPIGNRKAMHKLRIECEKAKRALSESMKTSIQTKSFFDDLQHYNYSITRKQFEELCDDLFRSSLDVVTKCLSDAKLTQIEIDQIVLIGGSSQILKIQELIRNYFYGKELNISINRLEAIACGASVMATILTGSKSKVIEDMLLLDVLSHSLGIEINGKMIPIIKRNSTIPTKQTYRFAITESEMLMHIYEGEHEQLKDNLILKKFKIGNISTPLQMEINFDIGVQNKLSGSLENKQTNELFHKINAIEGSQISKDEIEQMHHNAQLYYVDDQIEEKRTESHRNLLKIIDGCEQMMSEIKNKLEQTKHWIEENALIDKDQLDRKRTEIRDYCNYMYVFCENN